MGELNDLGELNDFPKIGINTDELVAAVEALIAEACKTREIGGAINWSDLSIVDVEYRLSMLHQADGPRAVVTIEEASPTSGLAGWIGKRIADRFPRVEIECEW